MLQVVPPAQDNKLEGPAVLHAPAPMRHLERHRLAGGRVSIPCAQPTARVLATPAGEAQSQRAACVPVPGVAPAALWPDQLVLEFWIQLWHARSYVAQGAWEVNKQQTSPGVRGLARRQARGRATGVGGRVPQEGQEGRLLVSLLPPRGTRYPRGGTAPRADASATDAHVHMAPWTPGWLRASDRLPTARRTRAVGCLASYPDFAPGGRGGASAARRRKVSLHPGMRSWYTAPSRTVDCAITYCDQGLDSLCLA